MTKEELIVRLSEGLLHKQVLTTSQAMNTIANLNAVKQDNLADAMNRGDINRAGTILVDAAMRRKKNIAQGIVEGILVDDIVTTDDLLTILA